LSHSRDRGEGNGAVVSVVVGLLGAVSKSSVLTGYLDSLSYSFGEGISVCLESIPCKDNTVANVPHFRGVSCVDSVGPIREASVSSHDHEIIPCNGYTSEGRIVGETNLE
jgi:hypothetical protein